MAGLRVARLNGYVAQQFPQAATVVTKEAATLDCTLLAQEIVKVHGVQRESDQTGRFDALSVMGFAGDAGPGNERAKRSARLNADARLHQLQSLPAVKCGQRLS